MDLGNCQHKALHQQHSLRGTLQGSAQEGERTLAFKFNQFVVWSSIWEVPQYIDKELTYNKLWCSWLDMLYLKDCATVFRFTYLSSKPIWIKAKCTKVQQEVWIRPHQFQLKVLLKNQNFLLTFIPSLIFKTIIKCIFQLWFLNKVSSTKKNAFDYNRFSFNWTPRVGDGEE